MMQYLLDADSCPLIAILRGLTTLEAPDVGQVLFDAGLRLIEVPLNRPDALEAMRALIQIAPDDASIGAGTVLSCRDVDAAMETGAKFIVSPNCEPEVIAYAVKKNLVALPGVTTPTEAFRALEAGAQGLKLFPAEMIPPSVVKALRSILPNGTLLFPVGGIHANNMMSYIQAGANGFGIGGQLYQSGIDLMILRQNALSFMRAREIILGNVQ